MTIGGVVTDGEGKSGTERLTEESSGFGEAPDLPYAVHGHCLVALDEHFTILTGGVGDPGNGSFYVHDWIKNRW